MYITSSPALQKILPELAAMPLLGVDTETTGLDPFDSEILLCQIGNLEMQYVIDARKCSLEPLRPILEGPTPKVAHNAKFDYKMLRARADIAMENMVDTMLIEQVLQNGRRPDGGYGLAAVVERHLRKQISKGEQTSFIKHTGDFSQEQLEYAQRDVVYPLEVVLRQAPRIRQANLDHTVKLECLAVAAIADVELNGIGIDQEKWRRISRQAEERATELRGQLDEAFREYRERSAELLLFDAPRTLNYDSDHQLKEALSSLGLDVDSTAKDILKQMDHPVAGLILEYRQHQKIVSTYGETFLEHVHPHTGRIHCDFRQMGAESGRLSSTKPNLQNIPADTDFRSCFIAGEGRKMITADYSGCELRILAQYSRDPEFMRVFQNDEDLHSTVASMMYGEPVSKTENPHLRQAAKAINFGLAYGMSSKGLAAQIGCDDEEAKTLLDKYFASFPRISAFLEQAASLAVSRGYSTTIGGRRRYFDVEGIDLDRRKRGSIERRGKNSPIQGTNADMIKMALFDLRRVFREKQIDALLVNTVHDEIVVECDADVADAVAEILTETMEAAGRYYVDAVPIGVDSHIADCWSK